MAKALDSMVVWESESSLWLSFERSARVNDAERQRGMIERI